MIKASPPTESTKQIYEDEFADSYDSNILPPPYNLKELKMIAEYSTILQQCVDAYRTNIVGFGFDFEYSFDVNSPDVTNEEKQKLKVNGQSLKSSLNIFTLMSQLRLYSDLLLKIEKRRAMALLRSFETVKISQPALNTWTFKMYEFANCLNQSKLILRTSNKDK